MTKAIVCGGRDFSDYKSLCKALDEIHRFYNLVCVIQGGAVGADLLARKWAMENTVPYEQYDADWKTYGISAGFVRNQQMLDEGNATLVIAFPGGNGTFDMIKRAQKKGVELINVVPEYDGKMD